MSRLEEEGNILRADVERALEQVGGCLNIVAVGVGSSEEGPHYYSIQPSVV